MTSIEGEPATGQTEPVINQDAVALLQGQLGQMLALHRRAAGLSQPELARALGRTRSALSKVENGHRTMPTELWVLADQACGADGALVAEHDKLTAAQHAYRGRCQVHHRQAQQQAAQAELQVFQSSPAPMASAAGLDVVSGEAWLTGDGDSARVGELMAVVERLVRSFGRRRAMQAIGWSLGMLGLPPGLDLGFDHDEHTRLAQAADEPSRVDAQVINTLALTLVACKRQEDKLGPRQILDTVTAQHSLVHRLLGGCPLHLRKALLLVDSNIACTLGWYLVEIGHHDRGRQYLDHARKAAHDATNPVCAAYAACNITNTNFLRRDTPAALDAAAAARALAARTNDHQLKALAEQQAASAYALDHQYDLCMAASDRAHNHLTTSVTNSDSPAYWMHHGIIDSQRSTLLALLGKPQQALDAATAAYQEFDRNYIRMHGFCQVRMSHALALTHEITEAATILGQAATHANLSPRLTTELHTTRKLLQPWQQTQAVKTLDDQLHDCGLLPNHEI